MTWELRDGNHIPQGLSGVVVARNEGHVLENCLGSLAFCDERIVVDLESTDDSAAIAQRAGARVVHHERVAIVERIRQFAADQALNDWIVFIDPDEAIPPAATSRIRGLIQTYSDAGLGMIYLPRLTRYSGKALRHGQKGGLRPVGCVFHKRRVRLSPQVHQLTAVEEPFFALGIVGGEAIAVQHQWVESIWDAVHDARRYLAYEGEKRYSQGMRFRWVDTGRQLIQSAVKDIRRSAFLDGWRGIAVMFFQLWYVWNANMSLRAHERGLERAPQ